MGRALGVGIAGALPGHLLGTALGYGAALGAERFGSKLSPDSEQMLLRILGLLGGATGGAVAQNIDGQFDPEYWDEKGNKKPRQPKEAKAMNREELLAQGACCGNRCRECPYEPRWQKGATAIRERQDEAKPAETSLDKLGPQDVLKAAMVKLAVSNTSRTILDPSGARDASGRVRMIANPNYDPTDNRSFLERQGGLLGLGGNIAGGISTGLRGVGNIAAGTFTAPLRLGAWGMNKAVDVAHNKDYYWNTLLHGNARGAKKMVYQQPVTPHEFKGNWGTKGGVFSRNGWFGNMTAPLAGITNELGNTGASMFGAAKAIAAPTQGVSPTFQNEGRWTTNPRAKYGVPNPLKRANVFEDWAKNVPDVGMKVHKEPFLESLFLGAGSGQSANRRPGILTSAYEFGAALPAHLGNIGLELLGAPALATIDKGMGRPGSWFDRFKGYVSEGGAKPATQAAFALGDLPGQPGAYRPGKPLNNLKVDLVRPWLPLANRVRNLWNRATADTP